MSEKKLTVEEVYDNRPRHFAARLIAFLILLALVVWSKSGINFTGIVESGADIAKGTVYGLTHPDWSLLTDMSHDGVLYLTAQTIAIAILGTLFGGILSIPISFLASNNIVPKPIAAIFRLLILLIRTIPSLVWALMLIRVTGPGAFCGVVTQSICSIGMISKMYITAIEDLDTGIFWNHWTRQAAQPSRRSAAAFCLSCPHPLSPRSSTVSTSTSRMRQPSASSVPAVSVPPLSSLSPGADGAWSAPSCSLSSSWCSSSNTAPPRSGQDWQEADSKQSL